MCEEEDSDGFGTVDREDKGVSILPTVTVKPDSVATVHPKHIAHRDSCS